jgi:hypothetical protein
MGEAYGIEGSGDSGGRYFQGQKMDGICVLEELDVAVDGVVATKWLENQKLFR